MTYIEFLSDSFDELLKKQDDFKERFDLDSYSNWFYDQASGLLTFSTDTNELNFRYIEVGTFSTKSNTWKWSWDNDHTLPKVKKGMELVLEFGKANHFEKLTTGLIDSEANEGWEFTAIACKLLNGMGTYRPVSNNLQIFMVIYELVDNLQAKEEKEKYVDCVNHERRRRAFICKHLKKNKKTGFHEAFETVENMEFEDDDDDFQAWCDACEKVRLKNDGWNAKAMKYAATKVVCERCYFEIKETNICPPSNADL